VGCALACNAHSLIKHVSSLVFSNTVIKCSNNAHRIAAAKLERPAPTVKMLSLCDICCFNMCAEDASLVSFENDELCK
jgi:hypothetical protein